MRANLAPEYLRSLPAWDGVSRFNAMVAIGAKIQPQQPQATRTQSGLPASQDPGPPAALPESDDGGSQ